MVHRQPDHLIGLYFFLVCFVCVVGLLGCLLHFLDLADFQSLIQIAGTFEGPFGP